MTTTLKLRTFELARRIREWKENDDFKILIIYGEGRIGKTSYILQVFAQVMGEWKKGTVIDPKTGEKHTKEFCVKPNWEAIKHWIVFHPKDFLKVSYDVKSKEFGLIWDDAGMWLHALDFNNPFVKQVGKYLNVAGTDFGVIAFTTPTPKWVFNKIKNYPGTIVIKVIRRSTDTKTHKYRVAKAYSNWVLPDMKKSGVKKIFWDSYDAMMPDEVFAWYKPLREQYAVLAKKVLKETAIEEGLFDMDDEAFVELAKQTPNAVKLASKYDSVCDKCSGDIAKGDVIYWCPKSKKVWHVDCYEGDPDIETDVD